MPPDPTAKVRPPGPLDRSLPWACLAAGIVWTCLLRVPIVLNAPVHLDSDLAVDGLTLLEATRGQLRWHYPGTPHMGAAPVFLSLPQAIALGVGPETLVSGGAVAWALFVAAAFVMAKRAFGPTVAVASLVPLVFSSTGTLWLSGRITGGHLFTLFWHAGALAGLAGCLGKGNPRRWAGLGLWCGLGLWHDTLFVFTIAGIVAGGLLHSWSVRRLPAGAEARPPTGSRAARIRLAGAFLLGLVAGVVPAILGRLLDPHDAYGTQFDTATDAAMLAEHARLLLLECLPRLIAGHRLPDGAMYLGVGSDVTRNPETDGLITLGLMAAFALAALAVVARCFRGSPTSRAIAVATLVPALLVSFAFVANRNIFNSDNYRYLIFWALAWALGFGLLVARISRLRALGRPAAIAASAIVALALTADAATWYGKHRWIGPDFLPARAAARPVLTPMYEPAATHVFGDYWDVYRESFLTGGKVRAIPLPFYPDRFPGWSAGLGKGKGVVFVTAPNGDWRGLLGASLKRDGGDPALLDDLDLRWRYTLRNVAP
jgi:hypothetical protein